MYLIFWIFSHEITCKGDDNYRNILVSSSVLCFWMCTAPAQRKMTHTLSSTLFFYKCMRGCHRLPKTQEARWIQYHPPPPNTCQKSAYSLHRPVILWKRGRLLLASCVTLGKVAVDFHPFFSCLHLRRGVLLSLTAVVAQNSRLGVRDISSNGWGCCSLKPVIVVTKELNNWDFIYDSCFLSGDTLASQRKYTLITAVINYMYWIIKMPIFFSLDGTF